MKHCTNAYPDVIREMRKVIKENKLLGLAANQIGFDVKIIIVNDTVMYNPNILEGSDYAESTEGCYTVEGTHIVLRARNILVHFLDEDFNEQIQDFNGEEAIIIQHETDHINGITIDDK